MPDHSEYHFIAFDARQSAMDIHPWTGINTFLALETVTADIQRTGLRQTDV